MSVFRLAAASLLALVATTATVGAVPQLDKTYWNSNWNAMYFEKTGNQVSCEYIFDEGVITATLSGDTLRGFWREFNNAQSCGPEGKWSGRIAFLFDSTGKAFTGDWDYCGDSAALNLNATDWVGTWRDSAYNESECGSAGRHWCDGKCQIPACNVEVTETSCLATGRFWCSGTCSLAQCSSAIRRISRDSARQPQSRERRAGLQGLFDLQGRCVDKDGRLPAGVFMGPGL